MSKSVSGLARERPLGRGDDPEEVDEPMTEHVVIPVSIIYFVNTLLVYHTIDGLAR